MAKGLTADGVKHAKPSRNRAEIPDGFLPGLYLIVQPSGVKSWAVRYRAEGKPTKHTLGRYPAMSLKSARQHGQAALRAVAEGGNPAAEKAKAKVEAKRPKRVPKSKIVEFEAVVNDFVERYAKKRYRDWKGPERLLTQHFVPRWRGMEIGDITKSDVIEALDDLVESGMGAGANRAFSQLRKLFNWLVENVRLDKSPCYGLKKPVSETARDRYLSDYEVFLYMSVSDALPYPWGPAYKMLIYTGQRLSEVTDCIRPEITGNHWSIPKERTKNKRPQELLLPRQAVEIIEALPHFSYTDETGVDRKSPFLFTTVGYSPTQGYGKKKDEFDRLMLDLARERGIEAGDDPDEIVIPNFTNHDLRRTLSTNLGRLKIRAEVIEAALNHVSGKVSGVAAVYNRWEYFDEKGEALQTWADLIDTIVAKYSGKNIVELRAAK